MTDVLGLSTVELTNLLAKYICTSGGGFRSFRKPLWNGQKVAISDGHIAIVFDCETPSPDWVTIKAEETIGMISQAGFKPFEAIALELPEVGEHECWHEPYKAIPSTCDECHGTGVVECEYGHEHECPECSNGGTFRPAIANYLSIPVLERAVEIPGASVFDKRYIWIIRQLAKHRSLRFGCADHNGGQSLQIEFDGGRGVLMALWLY